ncbi:ABC transporter permease [Coprobacillus sp. AM37-9BH]|jgi:putative ABC transport system permease protein|nr:ABC transporter permease [Coprobacillus sp. AM37-9BH]
MIKNALLSLKKNIGKTILLFVIIVVITNLVIAGLSIQSATKKSMDQIRSSLGNDVTLSVDFRNMMKNRKPSEAVSNETSLTTTMADSLKDLKYVKNYNYQISTSANSNSISAVETASDNSNNQQDTNKPNDQPEQASNQVDFTISANTTMKYLDSFTNNNYKLTKGRLLTTKDQNTNNCVIETNLASDNDLSVGDTFTITTTVNDETITQELTIVGIYEIQSTNEIGSAHFNNPVNTIYTDLSIGQTLTGSSENITSAIYYLDDPENAEAFVELAKKKSDIDFDTFSLDANNRLYQQNASSLESMQSFAKMFVWIVVIAGSAILCLILALTIRNRYYEIGVLLSLGQSKVKIIAQQLIEVGLIAVVAFVISLGTGQLTSHYMGNMLESSSSSNVMQMSQKGDQPNDNQNQSDSNQQKNNTQTKENFLGNMMQGPSNQELDVSITGENVIQLAGVTAAICIVSIAVPAAYVLRLTPRQILSRKEG